MKSAGSKYAGLALAIALASCTGAPGDGSVTPASPAETQQTAAPAAETPIAPTEEAIETEPTGEPAGSGHVILTVWMPDTLYEASDAPGKQAFLDQLSVFDEQHPEIQVQVLAKRMRGPGGTLSYLQSAPNVAPSILPDIVLVDRDALVEAARAELVIPIQEAAAPSLMADLYPAAVATGQINGEVTGLPYLIEVDHIAYRQTVIGRPPQTFDQVLASGQMFAFAGGVSSGVSPVVLLQYLASGGSLADEKSQPAIDTAALTEVLDFYALASQRKSVTAELFQLPDTASVWAMYRDRQANLVAVTSTQYLAGLPQVTSTRASQIPTQGGEPEALARGWSWVLVAHDPERQEAALSLLTFLMTPANQARYTEAAHYLPTQASALALWESQDTGYPAFATQLLTNARPMPDTSARAIVGVAMQDALEAVILNGVQPAQAATRAADAVKSGQPRQP